MSSLPDTLADFGPAALAAVIIAGYLVVGEPFLGYVLHRRFEAQLRSDPEARLSFYRRLLVLEWGLSALVVVVWAGSADLDAGQLGLRWPQQLPGPLTTLAVLVVLALLVLSVRALRSGALAPTGKPDPSATRPVRPWPPRPGERRHAEAPGHAAITLLPRSPAERRLFGLVGITAGICEEWLYRGFFLAVVTAAAPGLPVGVLVVVAAIAFGTAHAYQGASGVATTGVLGGVLAALYLQTGSLLLPVLLHVAIDLRFLLVPTSKLPSVDPESAW